MPIVRKKTCIHTHRLLSYRNPFYKASVFEYQLKNVAYHYACIPDSNGLWELMEDQQYFEEQYRYNAQKSMSYETLKIGIAHQIRSRGMQADVRLSRLILKSGSLGHDAIHEAHIVINMFQKDSNVLDDVFGRITVLREEGIVLACMLLLQVESQREASSIHNAERILLFLEDTIPENLVFWDEFIPSSFAATWIQEIVHCWPELNLAPLYSRCNDIRAIVYEICSQETTKDLQFLQNLLTFTNFISEPEPKVYAMCAIAKQKRLIQNQDAAIQLLQRIEKMSEKIQGSHRIEDALAKVAEEYILHRDFENGLRLIDSFSRIEEQASLLISLEKQMRAMDVHEDARQIRDRAYAYAKNVIYPWKQYAMFLNLIPAFKKDGEEAIKELKNSAIQSLKENNSPRTWVPGYVHLARFQYQEQEYERSESSLNFARRLIAQIPHETDRADALFEIAKEEHRRGDIEKMQKTLLFAHKRLPHIVEGREFEYLRLAGFVRKHFDVQKAETIEKEVWDKVLGFPNPKIRAQSLLSLVRYFLSHDLIDTAVKVLEHIPNRDKDCKDCHSKALLCIGEYHRSIHSQQYLYFFSQALMAREPTKEIHIDPFFILRLAHKQYTHGIVIQEPLLVALRALISKEPYPSRRAYIYKRIAEEQFRQGMKEAAYVSIEEGYKQIQTMRKQHIHAIEDITIEFIQFYIHHHDYQAAYLMAQKLIQPKSLISNFMDIANLYIQDGQYLEGQKIHRSALQIIKETTDKSILIDVFSKQKEGWNVEDVCLNLDVIDEASLQIQAQSYAYVAKVQYKNGLREDALKSVRQGLFHVKNIENPDYAWKALEYLALAAMEFVDENEFASIIKRCIQRAHDIPSYLRHSEALFYISCMLREYSLKEWAQSTLEAALDICANMNDDCYQAHLYLLFEEDYQEQGKKREAQKKLELALSHTKKMFKSNLERDSNLLSIAMKQVTSGNIEEALQTIKEMRFGEHKQRNAYLGLIQLLLKEREFDLAWEMVRKIPLPEWRAHAVVLVLQEGENSQNDSYWTCLLEEMEQIEDVKKKAEMILRISKVQGGAHFVHRYFCTRHHSNLFVHECLDQFQQGVPHSSLLHKTFLYKPFDWGLAVEGMMNWLERLYNEGDIEHAWTLIRECPELGLEFLIPELEEEN